MSEYPDLFGHEKRDNCPFCGSDHVYMAKLTGDVAKFSVFCSSCGASGPVDPGWNGATEKWNKSIMLVEFPDFIEVKELEPCPFCGSDEVYMSIASAGNAKFYIRCGNCDAGGPTDLGRSGALEQWNTRIYVGIGLPKPKAVFSKNKEPVE